MSGRFDAIDLNSDVFPAERIDEFHGVNSSVTLTDPQSGEIRLGEGLEFVVRANDAETGTRHRDGGDGALVVNRSSRGEIVANDGKVGLGLDSGVPKDLLRFEKGEHMDKNSSAFSGEAVLDRSRKNDSETDEAEGKIATSDGAHCSEKGEDHNEGLNKNKDVATEIQQSEDIKKRNAEQADLKLETQGKICRTEKEGQFCLNDLVWGKVKSHPWWPGQIFDPSHSSEKAKKYSRKDSFLVAYFGDQTFAWNDGSRLKPFRTYFSQMEKQSSSEAFCDAVCCALEEISRRVEFGLACSCLLPEVFDKINTQVVVNAGIREESSRRMGGDEYSGIASFNPVNLVYYMKSLARSPCGGTDRLEIATARAQLLAFNRWKGCYWLPEFKLLSGLSEDGADISVAMERKSSEEASDDTLSGKYESISGDGVSRKKERPISDLMSCGQSNLSSGKSELEEKSDSRLTSLSSVKKRKTRNALSDIAEKKAGKFLVLPVNKPQFAQVGESMRRVASRLTVSTPILKDCTKRAIGENRSNKSSSKSNLEKSLRRKIIAEEYFSPHDMLSRICLAARDPIREHGLLIPAVDFFCNYRNSFCLEHSTTGKYKNLTEAASGKQTEKLVNLEAKETSGFGDTGDSYWTDRIAQSNPGEQVFFKPDNTTEKGNSTFELGCSINPGPAGDSTLESPVVHCDPKEQVLFEPEIPPGKGNSAVEQDAKANSGPVVDFKLESLVVNCEVEAKPDQMDETSEEEDTPTALVLNFTDFDSVPSGSNLNKIFSSYGPLIELDTEVLEKSKRAKVVFKRRSDAENAFSSTGKFSIFGPSLVSYRLKYLPSTSRKTPTSTTKRHKKGTTSADGSAV